VTPLSDAALERLRSVAPLPEFKDTRYTLLRRLGQGGMGTVYLGRDELLEREVAVKVAHAPVGSGGAALAERLRAESRVLASLEHPAIVPVHDAGVLADGRVFYVMKRVHGQTLGTAVAGMPALDRRIGVLERVAEAVAFAHRRGVIHRDLKPGNIMVGEFGEVLVLDWGVAKVVGGVEAGTAASAPVAGGQTDPGSVLGTAGFMAPEQAAGAAVDRRADVHALGALLVFLLTDTAPSAGQSALAVLREAKGVPRPLAAIARRCLAAEASSRYPDAAAVGEEIRRYRAGARVEAYREGPLERVGRWARAYRVPILLVLAYLVMRVVVALIGR